MIHSTAIVDKSAIVSDSAQIGAMAYVGPNCVIHDNVKIGIHAVVESHTEIGENTVLSPNAHVGGEPQDIGYRGEDTKLIIGKNNVIREFVTIHRATTKEDWKTVVGDNCYFMAYVHIAHDCKVGNNVIMANVATLSGHIEVGDSAFISGLTGAHQFTRIGTMAMVSALSRLSKDVPPYSITLSDQVMGINAVGMKRKGVPPEVRIELKKAMHILLNQNLTMDEVKKELVSLEQFPEIVTFRNFLDTSKRGVSRW